LPNEILELIFIFYLELDDPAHCVYYPTDEDAWSECAPSQHVLTAVSTRWNALMESTPKLWSYIGLHIMEYSSILKSWERKCYARRLDILLRHSKDYPLNVSLVMDTSFDVYYNVTDLEDYRDAIENLFAQSSRWRSAILSLGEDMALLCDERELSIHWPIIFPQLESLTIIERGSSDCISCIRDHGRVFLNAPNLKHLHIDSLCFHEFQYLQIPFHKLRTLELPYDWSRQAVLQTLQAVSQLDYLCLKLKRDTEKIIASPMNVVCKELVLVVWNEGKWWGNNYDSMFEPSGPGLEISQFFERVQFVGTKSVTLDSHKAHWTAAQIQGLLYSIQPSMPDLTCLSLKRFVFSEKDLISLLPLLPSLQILRIFESSDWSDYRTVGVAFLHALVVPQADSSESVDTNTIGPAPIVVTPQLRELELNIKSYNPRFMDLLVDIVRSRPRLRLLKVVPYMYEARDEKQPLQEILKNLNLRLASCRPDFRIKGRSTYLNLECTSIHRS
jgi:hypothetical protein